MAIDRPLLSLCCSTYSRPDLFRESLQGLLRQTYEPLEVIVLVDGGNQSTIEILKEQEDKRLRWFTTERPSGMIQAWNSVVSKSHGKYFLYCADDDVLLERAVERQIDLLERNTHVGFCHADFYLVDDMGNQIGKWESHEGDWIKEGMKEWKKYLCQPRCCMQTTVVRRELWDKVGGWDEDAGYPGDNSLYLKLLRTSDVGHVARYACNYRIRTSNPDSWAKNAGKVKEDIALARKHLNLSAEQLPEQVAHLHKKVNRHFCRNALSVLADKRATRKERIEFVNWLTNNLLFREGIGSIYRLLIKLRMERVSSVALYFDFRLRDLARSSLVQIRRLISRGH